MFKEKLQKIKKMIFKGQKGFALLFAVLLSGLLLVIGTAIFSITIKEIILSSAARDSVFAFYAADTGLECALYWDRREGPVFADTSGTPETPAGTITCLNQDPVLSPEWQVAGSGGTVSTTFGLQFESESYCSVVTVTKSSGGQTVVESRGYNTCDADNPRRLERGLRAIYTIDSGQTEE